MPHNEPPHDTAELITTYAGQVDVLAAHVTDLSRDQLLARPIAGKWSTLEVVCHLADTEIYLTDRIERTISLERPLLIGVDEAQYPARIKYQELDLAEELEVIRALRRRGTRILRLQPAEAWQRTAVHSEAGLLTLHQIVSQTVRHLDHHLRFIVEKRAALGVAANRR